MARQLQTAAVPISELSIVSIVATKYNMEAESFLTALAETVVPKDATMGQVAAFLTVCNEYSLNPLLKEIYAFIAKGGNIVPMVGVDGWIRLMNSHPAMDGIEFEDIMGPKGELTAIEATIWRKDRDKPVKVIEYMSECKRDTDPWKRTGSRMLRHRALIQCARYAFGFSGIYAPDDDVEPIEMLMQASQRPMKDATPAPVRRIAAVEIADADGVLPDRQPAARTREVKVEPAKQTREVAPVAKQAEAAGQPETALSVDDMENIEAKFTDRMKKAMDLPSLNNIFVEIPDGLDDDNMARLKAVFTACDQAFRDAQ